MFKTFFQLKRRQQRFWLYPLMSVLLAISLIVGTPQVSQASSWFELLIRGVQIFQLSNMSDKQEVQLGKQINQQIVREVQLYRNREINRYIDEIGQRLAAESIRPNIPYTFQVVKDDSINAFATMGGFVYLNTGLIKTADNESQLASVMAHEVAHVAGEHALQQMRQTAIARGVAAAAGLDRSTAVNIGVELALRRPNSRQDELEADQLGLENLKKAGYAPIGMVEFMEKLQQKGGSVPAILSTHPATSDRVQALKQAINPAQANVGDGLDNRAYRNNIRVLL
ncbi:MAG: M48 family metallopeptidase [Coleofasciculaceae cyanobacterium]